jgi:hypothetical protein
VERDRECVGSLCSQGVLVWSMPPNGKWGADLGIPRAGAGTPEVTDSESQAQTQTQTQTQQQILIPHNDRKLIAHMTATTSNS